MDGKEMRDERTYKVIGAGMEVHKELGCGFLESVYQEALAMEMRRQKIPYLREVKLPLRYKNEQMSKYFKADFICFDEVVVEIKALLQRTGIEEYQLINYLKATGHSVGLLLNFGRKTLEYKRYINTYTHQSA